MNRRMRTRLYGGVEAAEKNRGLSDWDVIFFEKSLKFIRDFNSMIQDTLTEINLR